MTSIIDENTHIQFQRLCLPKGIHLNSDSPSILPEEGSVAYCMTTCCVYFADGERWVPIRICTT